MILVLPSQGCLSPKTGYITTENLFKTQRVSSGNHPVGSVENFFIFHWVLLKPQMLRSDVVQQNSLGS